MFGKHDYCFNFVQGSFNTKEVENGIQITGKCNGMRCMVCGAAKLIEIDTRGTYCIGYNKTK